VGFDLGDNFMFSFVSKKCRNIPGFKSPDLLIDIDTHAASRTDSFRTITFL